MLCLAVVIAGLLSMRLRIVSWTGLRCYLQRMYLLDLIIFIDELVTLLLNGLLDLFNCVAIQIFEVSKQSFILSHKSHHLG
jgi:hypothetical protein